MAKASSARAGSPVSLPAPRRDGDVPLEHAISARRSMREFAPGPITLADLAQILWAAQGISDGGGLRTAPSAGALYPLELYVVAGEVEGLAAGLYRYEPRAHVLRAVGDGDQRRAVAAAALGQDWIAAAAAVLVIAAVYRRTAAKYGARGERYIQVEAGHAGQNACLQAAALGLGTTVVGAFADDAVKAIIGSDQPGEPIILLPVGRV
jgi:SagB-type dehydrogenase family enzyme